VNIFFCEEKQKVGQLVYHLEGFHVPPATTGMLTSLGTTGVDGITQRYILVVSSTNLNISKTMT